MKNKIPLSKEEFLVLEEKYGDELPDCYTYQKKTNSIKEDPIK